MIFVNGIGISQNDLLVLESHVVFSDSKEKAAACFFIVQCTQSGKGDIQLPIKDVIDRYMISFVYVIIYLFLPMTLVFLSIHKFFLIIHHY